MSATLHTSLDKYHRMIERGDFLPREKHRVELIHGEIRDMSPISRWHRIVIERLTEWSYDVAPRSQVAIGVQVPITLVAQSSEPEPDLTWTRRADYTTPHPPAELVLLLVEVASSSLARDLGEKQSLYAEAGITDYWVVNIAERAIEVLRDPRGSVYATRAVFRSNEAVRPLMFPELALPVARLFE